MKVCYKMLVRCACVKYYYIIIIISKQKAVTTYIIFEEKFWFFLENWAEMQWKRFV